MGGGWTMIELALVLFPISRGGVSNNPGTAF